MLELKEKAFFVSYIAVSCADIFKGEEVNVKYLSQKCFAYYTSDIFLCLCASAGSSAGEAQGHVRADAGPVAARRKVPPSHRSGAGHGETQARRLHEQERRLHQPPGAGEREVRMRGLWELGLRTANMVFTYYLNYSI